LDYLRYSSIFNYLLGGSITTLLHIEVSPMGENSISRAVTAEFLDAWKAAHPDGTIIERDLAANPV